MGKLIVIDGTDGSGKATQARLLKKRLTQEGLRVKLMDFPRYGERSASLVEDYLKGKFGSAKQVGPYIASIFYACDRYAASEGMHEWLNQGGIIISNRYVSANKGHQLGKIREPGQRNEFLRWLNHLEYEIFGIPREDLNLLLYVPPGIGQKLAEKRDKKKTDIHQADLDHLIEAADAFMYAAKHEGWAIIECTRDGEMLPRKTIHEMLYDKVKGIIR